MVQRIVATVALVSEADGKAGAAPAMGATKAQLRNDRRGFHAMKASEHARQKFDNPAALAANDNGVMRGKLANREPGSVMR